MGQISSPPSSLDVVNVATQTPQAAPASGVTYYWRSLAGFPVLAYRTPYGREKYLFPGGLNALEISFQAVTTNAVPSFYGHSVSTFSGAQTNPALNPAGALVRDRSSKTRWASPAVINSSAGFGLVTGGVNYFYRAVSGSPGDISAGYFFGIQGSLEVTANQRVFIGMTPSGTIAGIQAVDPSTIVNSYCFGKDAADTNFQWMHRGPGAANKVDTGWNAAARAAHTFNFFTYSPGNQIDQIGMTVQDLDAGDEISFITNSAADMPAVDVSLHLEWFLATAADPTAVVNEYMHLRAFREP